MDAAAMFWPVRARAGMLEFRSDLCMTISDIERGSSNTIATENDGLRHEEHSSDIRGSDDHADGGNPAPRHGLKTIVVANKEICADQTQYAYHFSSFVFTGFSANTVGQKIQR